MSEYCTGCKERQEIIDQLKSEKEELLVYTNGLISYAQKMFPVCPEKSKKMMAYIVENGEQLTANHREELIRLKEDNERLKWYKARYIATEKVVETYTPVNRALHDVVFALLGAGEIGADPEALKITNDAQRKLIAELVEALEEVAPHFLGEYYPDHPSVLIVEKALAKAKEMIDERENEGNTK